MPGCAPELVLEGRTQGEPRQVLANAGCEQPEQRVPSECGDADVGRDGPPGACKTGQFLRDGSIM